MRVHQAVKHRVLWQRQLKFPSSSPILQYPLISIHLLLLRALSLLLSLLLIIPLHLHPLLCEGKWGTAQYAKDYGGMLSKKGRQTLTGHFHCAPPPPHNNHCIGASFDFPTVWVSLLRLYLLQTSYKSLFLYFFISLFLPCAYPLPDCVRVTAREFSCQRVLQLEGKVNGVDRWISYQYRLFWRTRPPNPLPS